MSEARRRTQRDEEDSSEPHGGIDISGEVRAGGDVVGRDKIQAGGDVVCNGKARLLENGLIAVSGNLKSLGNLNVVVTFRLQVNSDQIVEVQSAAVQLLRIEGTTFGWVALPNALVAPFADDIRSLLGGNYTVVGVQAQNAAQWAVTVEGK